MRTARSQFAWQSTIAKAGWALEYYQRKRRAGKSHGVAVRALANQWVRLIHAIWRSEQPSTEAVLRAAQQAHARLAA